MASNSLRTLLVFIFIISSIGLLPSTPVLAATIYDNASISFTGSWTHGSNWPRATGNTTSYTNVAGSRATLSFYGQRVVYYYSTASNRGGARIFMDGTYVDFMYLYTSDVRWRVGKVYTFGNVGNHTISIEAYGNGYIDVDAFEVDPVYTANNIKRDNTYSIIRYGGLGWTSSRESAHAEYPKAC